MCLDQGATDGEGSGGGARLDAQLGQDAGDVVGGSLATDGEGGGDLGIGETLDEQAQHLPLTLRQSHAATTISWNGAAPCVVDLGRDRGCLGDRSLGWQHPARVPGGDKSRLPELYPDRSKTPLVVEAIERPHGRVG